MVASELDNLKFEYSDEQEFIPTRESLISRLRQKENEGWREFFETYWKLIYNAARKSGLTDTEAQEVVQETMIGVSRRIPGYRYDPELCSFKTWLMNLVRWRVVDQFRNREDHATLDQAFDVADEKAFARLWEEDWERNLINAAVERIRNNVRPQEFQIFAYSVLQKNGPKKTAEVLNLSITYVNVANHRVMRRLQEEIKLIRQTGSEMR